MLNTSNNSMDARARAATFLSNCGVSFGGLGGGFAPRQRQRCIEQKILNEFGELVAINRGLLGKAFDEIEEAEKWLSSK